METIKHRVVTYLSKEYKEKLSEYCKDREDKEARVLRDIIKLYFDSLKVSRTAGISRGVNER